jgi:hypothetical protein
MTDSHANFFRVHPILLLRTLTASGFSDGGKVPFGQKGDECMRIKVGITQSQMGLMPVCKEATKVSKLAIPVRSHFGKKDVCLIRKSTEGGLRP